MINEFGENISEEEISGLAKKIRRLSPKEIDHLWNLCGWIDKEKGENEALPDWRIEGIRESQKMAREQVKNLLTESHKQDVMKNLNGMLAQHDCSTRRDSHSKR